MEVLLYCSIFSNCTLLTTLCEIDMWIIWFFISSNLFCWDRLGRFRALTSCMLYWSLVSVIARSMGTWGVRLIWYFGFPFFSIGHWCLFNLPISADKKIFESASTNVFYLIHIELIKSFKLLLFWFHAEALGVIVFVRWRVNVSKWHRFDVCQQAKAAFKF